MRSLIAAALLLASGPSPRRVQLEMKNVRFHPTDTVALEVRELRGEMVVVAGSPHPVLGDASTFHLKTKSGSVLLPPESLAAVMNEYVFDVSHPPIKDISIAIKDGKLEMRGKLMKAGIGIPFEMRGDVSANDDGRVRVHPTALRALDVPVKGLADRAGITLEDVVNVARGHGLEPDGNDMLLDTEKVVPPPIIEGPVIRASIEAGGVRLEFGRAPGVSKHVDDVLAPPMPRAPNFIFLRQGTMVIGRLTMSDTLMQIVDLDGQDPLDFHQQRFEKEQLPRGREIVMKNGGLEVFIPDFEDVSPASPPVRK